MVLDQLEYNNTKGLKNLIIGFDIDDVLTDTTTFEFEMLKKWCLEIEKIGYVFNHVNQSGNTLATKYPDLDDIQLKKFFTWYFPIMVKEAPLSKYTKELFHSLKELGVKIYIVTRRDEFTEKYEYTGPMMRQDTEERFKENGIEYDRIFFSSFDKLKVMEENNIDILVDDSLYNIFQVRTKKPVIVMTRPYNESVVGKNIYRIKDLEPNNFISILLEIMRESKPI